MQYDVWVTPGREEMISVAEGGQTYEVKIRNYYGAIDSSEYQPDTKTIEFSMPFDWTSDLPSRMGMLHTEVFIPKEMADFDKDSLRGKVNGIDVPVFVVPTSFSGDDTAVVHFTISKQNLINIAERVKSENLSPDAAVFSEPTGPGKWSPCCTDLARVGKLQGVADVAGADSARAASDVWHQDSRQV